MMNKNTRRGFTLIELLVVVLIIGILAAVALPQYKLAVTKARVATILPIMKSIADAEEVYYLANGEVTTNSNMLDIEIPQKCSSFKTAPNLFKCDNDFMLDLSSISIAASYCPDNNVSYATCINKREFVISFRHQHIGEDSAKRTCTDTNDSALGNKVCSSLVLN